MAREDIILRAMSLIRHDDDITSFRKTFINLMQFFSIKLLNESEYAAVILSQ